MGEHTPAGPASPLGKPGRRAWALARFPERVCKVLEPGTGRQGAEAKGGEDAERRRMGGVGAGMPAVRHRRLEWGMWLRRLAASGWAGEPARGGRNEVDEWQERGQ